jgi:molecular chaperone HtpG
MPRVLELKPNHPIAKKLARRAKADEASSDALLKDEAHLLLDQERIYEGEIPTDPADFERRLSAIMDIAV